MIHVSQESPRFTVDACLHSALFRHRLKNCLRVGLHSETDLVIVMFVSLRRPETHIIQLLVARGSAHSLKGCRVVHVDVGGGVAPLSVIDDVSFAEWAFIELVDIAGVKVLGYVEHFVCLTTLYFFLSKVSNITTVI